MNCGAGRACQGCRSDVVSFGWRVVGMTLILASAAGCGARPSGQGIVIPATYRGTYVISCDMDGVGCPNVVRGSVTNTVRVQLQPGQYFVTVHTLPVDYCLVASATVRPARYVTVHPVGGMLC